MTDTTTPADGADAGPGYRDVKGDVQKRLNRIEGQVRGLRRMVDEDTYCIDVLTQVSAVTRALQAVAVNLIDSHVRHCVRDAAASGDDDLLEQRIAEVSKAVERLVKS